ncbi:hypothetical protein IWC96_14585 [Brevundimonas sp. BAL450]|uniref:hypothetical protein n=1 Tax=Brevundimonas sp. BAL450 TaxID=1708162 RepID=UPI0018CAF1E9|nr:hypothetical protein [Brevundimonas sp. BAL450]MBG7616502.1 hypothetical protein [Brevundimonas sp. BAL450]
MILLAGLASAAALMVPVGLLGAAAGLTVRMISGSPDAGHFAMMLVVQVGAFVVAPFAVGVIARSQTRKPRLIGE